MTHADMATRCRASTSPGGPAPRSSRCSRAGCTGTDKVALRPSAPRRRADRRRRCGRRRARRGAGADDAAARGGVVAKRRRRVRVPRAGGDRGQRRHRRQPRPGAAELAEADGPGARAAAQRRARTRRRPDDRHQRVGGCARHQQRPDVALHRGHHQLRPDLARSRHPDPACAVVAVARRHREAAARTAVPGLRHPRHAGTHRAHRTGLHLVRAERPHHRQGVRAVRAGAEPRPHRAQRPGCAGPGASGRARAGAGVRRQGRRLRQRKHVAGVGVRDERRPRRHSPGLRHRRGRRSPHATGRSPTGSPRTPR